MALSAPTLTAPSGFALRWVRRASPKGAYPPLLILGAGGGVPSAGGWRETYLILMYDSTRGTRDGGLYTCRRSPKTDRLFVRSRSKKPARFPAGASGAQKHRTPLPPSAAPAGITHYTLLRKVVCQRGPAAPFGNPRFRPAGRVKGLPPPSIHQSIHRIIQHMD